jgi:glycerophosphoryl diester phosphodiesterase
MAAFEQALELGADGFELDTMLSAEGIPVVIHDEHLDRTTNGKGKVASKSASEIRQLDAGSWFGEQFVGEKVPLLENVLEQFKGRGIINIELKNFTHPFDGLVQKVIMMVKRMEMFEETIISSFFPGNITYLQRNEPISSIDFH